MSHKGSSIWQLLKATFSQWREDNASRLAAALAYYTIFSLAPLLVIVIAVAGFFYGEQAARGEIVSQVEGVVGQQGAQAVQTMIKNAGQSSNAGILATILGVAALIFGATGVFVQLQDALNTVWNIEPAPEGGMLGVVRDRLISFGMVVGIGFVLLASLVISAALSALGAYFADMVPGYELLWQVVNFIISFAVITLLFAVIYKVLPDAELAWRDVWLGAAVTAVLFTIGKLLIGLYLGRSSVGSTYGAAGSLVVLLLWIYYSAQIFLFGAEFTQVYANKYGSHLVLQDGAGAVDGGMPETSAGSNRSQQSERDYGGAASVPIHRPPPYQEVQAGSKRPWYRVALLGFIAAGLVASAITSLKRDE